MILGRQLPCFYLSSEDCQKNECIFHVLTFQGERLSHAVGCAFAACLDKKQKRERETGVTARYEHNGTIFTREGSFRPKTLTEKKAEILAAKGEFHFEFFF